MLKIKFQLLIVCMFLCGCDDMDDKKMTEMKSPVVVISRSKDCDICSTWIVIRDGSGKISSFSGAPYQSLKPGDTIK